MLLMFMGAVCTTTQGMLLTDFIDHYSLESSTQGFMSAFQSAGNIVALLMVVFFIGKVRKINVITLSAFLIPAVFFVLGQKPMFVLLLICYCVYGVAFGFLDSLTSSIMVDLYTEKASGYMNVLHGVYGIGGFLGPIFMKYLGGAGLEWDRILFVLCAMSAAAALLYSAAAYPSYKDKETLTENASGVTRSDVLDFFRKGKKKVLLLCALLYGAHQIGITVWMTRYISEYLSSPAYGPLALSLFWLGIAVSRLLVSRFDFDPVKVVIVGHILSGLAVAVGVFSGSGIIMMACCGVAGFFEGSVLPMTLYLSCSWTSANTALGSSMILFAHYIGFVFTSPLIGFAISAVGVTFGMMIPAISSFAAAILAVALVGRGR